MDIALNIKRLRDEVPEHVKIVAISKTHPVSDIMIAYQAGHKIFGENRAQELLSKKDLLPQDIEWHFVGHLQTNKVKMVVPNVKLIHSVDSFKLLNAINKEAAKLNLSVECLLQFHIAREETKSGFTFEEALRMLNSQEIKEMNNVIIRGVMGMATFTDDMKVVRNEFRTLRKYFNILKDRYFIDNKYFTEISMGMSGDYRIAIEEGSTIIRVGTLIFGERNYFEND
ncbi:MAG TPA: YggS family pyridoxal phosphate-dependent enzyme [Bacteroidales bacterium]|nr:YggS family pyridoxal phosphate-dependent enzyme [Bacteroidales bacterium]HOK74392.1 YggS family pyridoxal phosphate-dependent enzyme [Bacteroidales bacterium]HOM41191.1 YggS family pyridoxal phosphate-dependent enzyme [Bacteroidales bacterium]HPP92819.1 YggS family pyridoxal phosphate-dependent enzyme [Bacteroidales bacterium]HQK70363.1 YggS family pyridoxal phosphate-dependent enzyme [Bacteroidales bacterium]